MHRRPLAFKAVGTVAVIAAAILGQNLFGRELNRFFLLYPGIDKVLHFVEYLAVVVVVDRVLRSGIVDAGSRTRAAAGIAAVIAIADEMVQQLAPGRSVEAFDLAADFSGIALGWVLTRRPSAPVAVTTATLSIGVAAFVSWQTHVLLRDYSQALQYERRHDFVRAHEYYRKAVARGLDGWQVYNGLAWVAVESGVGDPEEAVAYARRAVEIDPDNADVLDTYGWALHYAGRSAEALEPLQQAFTKKPDMFCIHYHLGAVYLALSRPADAAAHFRKQLELVGTREAAMAARALALMKG